METLESLGLASNLFAVFDKKTKIFSKNLVSPKYRSKSTIENFDSKNIFTPGIAIQDSTKFDFKVEADRVIQENYVPSGIIIDNRMEILQFRGDTSPYLFNPPGDATNNLFKMCRKGLFLGLQRSIADATTSRKPVKKIVMMNSTTHQRITIEIDVIPFSSDSKELFYVILFKTIDSMLYDSQNFDNIEENNTKRLEIELFETKKYLNAMVESEQKNNEELRSTSEELLSANEELYSTNEEIVTSKEEIQASNQELNTVNDELKRLNQDLNLVNSDLRNFFGACNIPMLILAEDLKIRCLTHETEKALNISQDDIGKSIIEISPKILIKGLEKLSTDVIKTLNTQEQEIQDNNGRWYLLRIKPYRTLENKINGVIITLVDIDLIKRSFDKIKEAHEYAEAIIQTVPIPLLVLDDNFKIITATETFYRNFKVTFNEEGKVYDLTRWNISNLRVLLDKIQPIDERVENILVEEIFPSLGRRFMRLNARRLVQNNKENSRILLAIEDVTKEKEAEEGAKKAKELAESANRAKSDFITNMSHELRTPLGAILGYTELLSQPNQTKSEKLNCISRINKNIEQLTQLIDEFLDLSKIEAGKLEVERFQFPLLPVLTETFTLLQDRAKNSGLAFNVIFSGSIPETIISCPKRLNQILLNVAGNALKFTEKGSVNITISLISNFEKTGSQLLYFIITDTGCGLTPEQQSKIFHPFTQADSSVTRKYGGSGIGLIFARRLAIALGGGLVLTDSNIDKGSTFSFWIDPGPLDKVIKLKGLTLSQLRHSKDPITEDEIFENKKLDKMRILLVEDGLDNRILLSHFLRTSGATLVVATNGIEGVKKAQEQNFDLILMDMQMPMLDGYEATKKLIANDNKTPIIALTAHAMRGEREKCLAMGCVDYISKPVKANLLIDTIAKHLKQKRYVQSKEDEKFELLNDPTLKPILLAFVQNLPKLVDTFRDALIRYDHLELSNLAHKLSGSAGTYGFTDIGEVAATIEVCAIKPLDFEVLEQLIDRLNILALSAQKRQ